MTSASGFERLVAASLKRAGMSGAGLSGDSAGQTAIVVACSGGPDSTALLRSLHRLRSSHNLSLHVAHLNHDFRGAEADHDAAFVQLLADRLGLPCSIDKEDPIAYQRSRNVSSFEQAAREMRYSFLHSVAATVGASAVALGHTSDDQAETVLLHILRGAGMQGLRGMAEVSHWPWPTDGDGPLLFRPLLDASKADTAAYCRELGQTYREDSGNYLWRFTRNRVRLDLMPRLARDYNPRVQDALLRLSRIASDDSDFLDSELDRRWDGIATVEETGVFLDVVELAELYPALQRRAMRRAYSLAAGDSRALGESHLDALLGLVQNRRGGRGLDLPRGVNARFEANVLRIFRPDERRRAPNLPRAYSIRVPQEDGETVEFEADGWRLSMRLGTPPALEDSDALPGQRFTASLKRDVLSDEVTLRTRRPGDRFQPSGMTGTKKLQDFFTDAKVPRDQRDSIPLLVCERGIAWVVGHRAADWARADDDSAALWVDFVSTG